MSAKRNSKKPDAFIVVYDDGINVLAMGQDSECDGALTVASEAVCLFHTKSAARFSINISRRFYELRRAQVRPANEDFSPANVVNVKVRPCFQRETEVEA